MSRALAIDLDHDRADAPDAAPRSAPAAGCAPAPERAPRLALVTASGASAELDRDGEAELLRVRDPNGAVLFEYDAQTGTGALRMPKNLRLCALEGSIELVAADAVRCVAAGEVALRSATSASVTVGGAGAEASGLRVGRDRAALASEEVLIGAKRAELHVERARYVGKALHAAIERAEVVATELETRAETLIETAGNALRRVKELHQLNAGRLRTLVEGALRMEGGHVVMRAKEEVHIDGEHINLG